MLLLIKFANILTKMQRPPRSLNLDDLFKEFNTDARYIGHVVLRDSDCIPKLEKYDWHILQFMRPHLQDELHGMFQAIVERRQQGGEAKNLSLGYNIMDERIKNIHQLIDQKYAIILQENEKLKIVKIKELCYYLFILFIMSLFLILPFIHHYNKN